MMKLGYCEIPRSTDLQGQNNEVQNLPQLQYKGMARNTDTNTVHQTILGTDKGMNTKQICTDRRMGLSCQ